LEPNLSSEKPEGLQNPLGGIPLGPSFCGMAFDVEMGSSEAASGAL